MWIGVASALVSSVSLFRASGAASVFFSLIRATAAAFAFFSLFRATAAAFAFFSFRATAAASVFFFLRDQVYDLGLLVIALSRLVPARSNAIQAKLGIRFVRFLLDFLVPLVLNLSLRILILIFILNLLPALVLILSPRILLFVIGNIRMSGCGRLYGRAFKNLLRQPSCSDRCSIVDVKAHLAAAPEGFRIFS